MIRLLKIFMPLLLLTAGGYGTWMLIETRPIVETRQPEVVVPLVRAMTVEMSTVRFKVSAQGTVFPRTEAALVPEISGRLIFVSPSLEAGAFFEEGEELLRIEPQDFELAVIRARADVARSEYRLEIERAEADVARKEWESLGRGTPSSLVLREPQMAEAQATLESARAALKQSQRDLERTVIRAPFAGRVREESVATGQYVSVGSIVARLYSVDYAEVRLPIPDDELAYVDLPLVYRGDAEEERGPRVKLTADFAGREFHWWGRIVRTEGEIDPRSRMVHVIARVKDPYGRGEAGRPPLASGLFVRAEIQGRTVRQVAVLPRSALRGADRTLVVSEDDRLFFRSLDILRRQGEEVVVRGGLKDGERVCLSPLDTVVEGMRVRTAADDTDSADVALDEVNP